MGDKREKIKERLSFFIEDTYKEEISVKVPNRVIIGFKLDSIRDILINVLNDKFRKDFKYVSYELTDDNEHIYRFTG